MAPEANADLARESGYWLVSKRGPGPRSRQITLDRFVKYEGKTGFCHVARNQIREAAEFKEELAV